jgi:hypothetical protein
MVGMIGTFPEFNTLRGAGIPTMHVVELLVSVGELLD